MKRKLPVILALLLVFLLAGCKASNSAAKPTEHTAARFLTKEHVKEIVFIHANAQPADITALEVELDEDGSAIFYDLEFDYGNSEYDYRVDAFSGKILYNKAEPKETAPAPAETQPVEQNPAETTPVETKPVETKPAETKPAETKPVETTPAETKPAETKPAETKPVETKPAEVKPSRFLTKAEVKKIVFAHANVPPADVTDLDVELDKDDGAAHYDLDFDYKNSEYDYIVDALSGKILYNKVEPRKTAPAPAETRPVEQKPAETTPVETKPAETKPAETKPAEVEPVETTPVETKPAEVKPATFLTKEQVKKIVFAHANVPPADVTDLDVELDKDDGAAHYDLDFDYKNSEYDYKVDALSGKILYNKVEPKKTAPAPAETQPVEQKPAETTPVEVTPVETKPAEVKPAAFLTKEKAKEIVFAHANVPPADVTDLDVELDKDDGAAHYDLDFDYKNSEYDYKVDALSGKILYNKVEPKKSAPVEQKPAEQKPAETTPATTATEEKIGVTKAKNIAFNHASVKSSDARDVEADLDTENGKMIYEISFDAGGYEYSYDIDAYTGKVLRNEKERSD